MSIVSLSSSPLGPPFCRVYFFRFCVVDEVRMFIQDGLYNILFIGMSRTRKYRADGLVEVGSWRRSEAISYMNPRRAGSPNC